MEAISTITTPHVPWNKGKLVGQKAPFKPKEIWAIRVRLQMEERTRELALFNLGIDSKLRACDLTALRVRDICQGEHVAARAIVLQRKTQRPVQFEITALAREAVEAWIRKARLQAGDFLFEPHPQVGAPRHAPVRPHPSSLGARRRARSGELRYTLSSQDQGNAHLPEDQEPSRRSAASRSQPHRVDLSVLRYRGR